MCRYFSKLKNTLMPYLYAKAVETSQTGLPMMRAMLLEFDDLGCEDCDRQYMLGDALLVAPVFREDGMADYYLPAGAWTHLLSGETVQSSGRWYRSRYDFFSLPLFVRENTILPVGSHEESTVYDYTDGLTLRLYHLADGAQARCTVCDSDGQPVLTAQASRVGDAITVTLTGRADTVIVQQVGTGCALTVERA